jgi:hypothetical protein
MSALHVLEQTPGVLRSLLSAVTDEDLNWRPAEDRWSIAMVLAHLHDVEQAGFRSRFHAMLESDGPHLPSYDQLALFRTKAEFDALAELAAFERERKVTLEFLKKLPSEAGARTGRHQELGEISVAELLNEFAFHDLGHIRQIAEVYRSHAFYPRMGGFRNYYEIHP